MGQAREIYQKLPYSVDFNAPWELWNPLGKTVFNECSFIWYNGPVYTWSDRKAQKHVGPVKNFPNFWRCISNNWSGC